MRRLTATATIVVLLASTLACSYSADHAGTQYRCSGQGECPPSYSCDNGVCRLMPVDAGALADAPIDAGNLEPDAAAPFVCPDACSRVADFELCYCAALTDFETGRALCATVGLGLARPDTPELSTALAEYVADLGTESRGFLGGTDLEVEGQWRWLDNNDLFWTGLADGSAPDGVFTDWRDIEPNQFMDTEEDCLLVQETGWNDIGCDRLRASYCGR